MEGRCGRLGSTGEVRAERRERRTRAGRQAPRRQLGRRGWRGGGRRFLKLANQLESAYDLLLSVKMVMEGMHTSLETAMSTACQITDLSRAHDLPLGDDGMPLQCPAPSAEADQQQAYREIVALRDQVVRQATEADEQTTAELNRLAGMVDISDPDKALKEQNRASHVEMDMLAADLPKANTDPAVVRVWWNGLSEKQQHDMMRAEPVKLAHLDGIPEGAKRDMRGTDGKFDRIKMVEYALDNWNKDDPVDFGNNCTNFVSNALTHAGMQEKTSFWEGTVATTPGNTARHRYRLDRRLSRALQDVGRSRQPAELHAQARRRGRRSLPSQTRRHHLLRSAGPTTN